MSDAPKDDAPKDEKAPRWELAPGITFTPGDMPALVGVFLGERGPEIVNLPKGTRIIPNKQ